MKEMTNNEKQLIEIYTRAQQALYNTITTKAAKGTPAAFERSLLKQVNAEIRQLNKDAKVWGKEAIPEEFNKGKNQATQSLGNYKKSLKGTGQKFYDLTQDQITRINKGAIDVLVQDTTVRLTAGNASLQKNIKGVLTQKFAAGQTVTQAKQQIVEQIYGANGTGKMTIKGRNLDPTKYAEMIARTSTREATNTASKLETQAVGSDLMQMSFHSPTCEICGPLQGRVYSISGSSNIYPPLEAAWGTNGYAVVHPNCRHVFSPYIEDMQTEEELKTDREWSSRPIDNDSRSKRSVERYDAQQKDQGKRWSDLEQYRRYQARLGKENVPGSFSGFRNMKKSNNQNWADLQADYRDIGYEIKVAK